MNVMVDALLEHFVARLTETPVCHDPFPHVVLAPALPPAFYAAVLAQLPTDQAFAPASYPGTGSFTSQRGGIPAAEQGTGHHGLVLASWPHESALRPLHDLLHHSGFSRALLDKFADPASGAHGGPAIPPEKHVLFADQASDYECVSGLYKDTVSYEISPHCDHPSKIVTFLLYVADDPLRPCGTMLCRPQAGHAPFVPGAIDYGAARREGRAGLWMDWNEFDVVKEVSGPNTLLAFAPSDVSFHGVKLRGDAGARCNRTVVRGFIASKGYQDTWLLPSAPAAPSPSLVSR